MTDWTIITRSLRARLFSTVTTVVTVAVAVGLMLVLLTMRDAGRKAFERGTGNMHLLLSRDASPLVSVLNGVFYAGPPQGFMLWTDYERLTAGKPFEFAVPVQLGDSFQGRYPVLATTPEFFSKFRPAEDAEWELAEGAFIADHFQVVAGSAVARGTGLKVGDQVVLTHGAASRTATAGGAEHEHGEFKYSVVGVLKPTGTGHDSALFTDLTSAWIIHAHDRIEREGHAEEVGEHAAEEEAHDHEEHAHHEEHATTEADLTDADRKITNVYIRIATRPGSDVSASIGRFFDSFRREPNLTVAAPTREVARLFGIVSNIDQLFVAIAAAVMVSSGIAIMLALYNSMEQRRRQIAVLRVLGASRGRIFGLIVTESAVIGLLGTWLGVLLAAVGAWLGAAVLKDRLGLVIDPVLDARSVVVVAMLTVALAAAAGLIPAVAAYRTSVAKNLRPLG